MDKQCSATIHNGALVSTRKGMVISKSQHQGTRFVNTFAPATTRPPADPDRWHSKSQPQDEALRYHEGTSQAHAHLNTPPQTATTPSSVATPAPIMRRSAEVPSTPMSNVSEQDEQRPGTIRQHQQSLHIPYLRPPVPKGQPSQSPVGLTGWPPPPDHNAPLAQRLVQQYLHNVPPRSYTFEAIALVASLANGGGSVPPSELGQSIAQVCASMNKDILLGDEDGSRSEAAVVESIAAMALEATYSGRQDHWHVLMRGLRDMVDRGGGMRPEWGVILNKVHKADVKGAAHAGSSPYLEFSKMFPPISDALSPHRRAELAVRAHHLLSACSIALANIESIQGLAFFTQTIIAARHGTHPQSILVDPASFAEDCLQVEHQLVRNPKALRDDMAETEALLRVAANPLDPLLRIAAILYIEDLLPDAHSVDLYTILLTALIHQSRIILQRKTYPESSPSPLPDATAVRPLLLWTCMVGHAIVTFTNAQKGTVLDFAVFEDLAAVTLGDSSGAAPADAEDEENELDLCELLPLGELRSVKGCDEEAMLRQLVAAHDAREAWH
ncbi:uncharacterized protein F5Z01DRAFT_268566 [Emericellopsis atlantica]|uniref:Uncharacterized protein n=1 Tax=Emericellopsis atlantica TaxID=2614577 RepID=A0A9P7ZGJ7_9HYPO|nr:uncharacterized protein F5Z01DRAFT_268566 [Emericellopsis atlantica]KAG9251516.1 hypothetical protein F5Z01DRAFT_268566 [Emericellopsis atlantica]